MRYFVCVCTASLSGLTGCPVCSFCFVCGFTLLLRVVFGLLIAREPFVSVSTGGYLTVVGQLKDPLSWSRLGLRPPALPHKEILLQ